VSPIQLPDGTTLPDVVPYVPRPPAVTSIVVNGTVTSTRAPVPGEPADDANHFDDAFEVVVAAVNSLLSGALSLGGARVYNDQTGQVETWPIYISTTDPASSMTPPANDKYVWINPAAIGGGSGGTSGPTTIDNVTGLVDALSGKVNTGTVYSRGQVDTLLAGIGAAGGGTVTLTERAGGYCPAGSTTPITQPATGFSYIFKGLSTPPFDGLWIVVDTGTITAPTQIALVSSDAFDTGKNQTTPAAAALDTTKWGGDNTSFRQGSDGTLVPIGWGTTARNYAIFDKAQAASAKMRAELQLVGYSSTATQRTLRVLVNVTDPNVSGTAITGYGVAMDTTTSGTSETWTVTRLDNGAGTSVGSFTRSRVSAPRSLSVESDGRGGIKVTVDGVVLNNGSLFVDPSSAPLSGRYAGVSGYCQSNSASASMNAKGEAWRLYA
jgi:hypothetical protein